MPNWLTKAKKAFKPAEPRPPEKYRLLCRCGESVTGERGEREQRAACPTCGFEMFVLPASIYPLPRVRPSKPRPPQPIPAEKQSQTAESRIGPHKANSSGGPSVATEPQQKRKELAEQPDIAENIPGIHIRKINRRKLFTPFRTLVVGILIVLSLTAYVVIHSRNIDAAQSLLADATKSGRQSLQAGDLIAAMEHFTAIGHALDTIGSDDDEAAELRQLAREVTAANELMPNTIDEMIATAAESTTSSAWQKSFQLLYHNKWIVLEASLIQGGEEGEFYAEFPVTSSGEEAVVIVSGETLEGTDTSQSLIIAGRLLSCGAYGSDPRIWNIHIDPDSIFLWENQRTYELIGFLLDESTVTTLTQQSELARDEP